MANVFSQFLFGLSNQGTGNYSSAPVPTGFVWVVRDVVVKAEPRANVEAQFAFAFSLRDNAQLPILSVPLWTSSVGVTYHWQGHQVVVSPGFLQAVVQGPGWSWRVSGYQLTLP